MSAITTSRTLEVLQEVSDERARQDLKWGIQRTHPNGTSSRLWSHARDGSRRITDEAAQDGRLSWMHILQEEYYEALAEEDPDKIRAELVQVAAVAVAWIESIDYKRDTGFPEELS